MLQVILVAHNGLARAYQEVALAMLGSTNVIAYDLFEADTPDQMAGQLERDTLIEGKAVPSLILSDITGGTPWRLATELAQRQALCGQVRVLSGMNLAMVVEAAALAHQNLDILEAAARVMKAGTADSKLWPEAWD